jgi:hypothetical protein
VLYLSLDEFPDRHVPAQLGRLLGDQFEIRAFLELWVSWLEEAHIVSAAA